MAIMEKKFIIFISPFKKMQTKILNEDILKTKRDFSKIFFHFIWEIIIYWSVPLKIDCVIQKRLVLGNMWRHIVHKAMLTNFIDL